jgi:predicted transcriptional regulator
MLLYCTKTRKRLFFDKIKQIFSLGKFKSNNDLNGKIVAECDFEVEEIEDRVSYFDSWFNEGHHTKTMRAKELITKSCLDHTQLTEYLGDGDPNEVLGYAIHIKNLHTFDKPKELQECATIKKYPGGYEKFESVERAPQNMQYVHDVNSEHPREKEVLISIRPEWLCKILNKEKTIEVRRVVLKEMLKND